jgi:hypothetical protein
MSIRQPNVVELEPTGRVEAFSDGVFAAALARFRKNLCARHYTNLWGGSRTVRDFLFRRLCECAACVRHHHCAGAVLCLALTCQVDSR